GERITWTSSLDGPLGTGVTLHADDLHVGIHVITATVVDHDGATEHTQVTVRVRPANQAPTIVIASPTDDFEVEPGEELHLSAGVSDDFDEDLAEPLHWTSNIDGPLPSGPNRTAHLSAGTHELEAEVEDSDGASTVAIVRVTVHAPPVATAPPVVTITSP